MRENAMDICEHIINILAYVIAVEYMEHGLEKKYSGWRYWLLFILCGMLLRRKGAR